MRHSPAEWQSLRAEHSRAVGQFISTAKGVPQDSWDRPLAEGKWTPAEVTAHLSESYRILRSELATGLGMGLRLGRMRRWVFRHTILPRILASGRFPRGARAPRETRPLQIVSDISAAVEALTDEAEAFAAELNARAALGTVHLTHAYFGPMSATQAMRLVTVHTRHHARQLETAVA
jgi:DinB superfamily